MTASTLVDLYLRLSVDREGKDALERQEADLREWAERTGLTVRKVWKDAGISGFKDVERVDFDRAVKAVARGEVGTLAVWKLDRLSRRGAGQVGLVLDQVEKVGGRLYFLKDGLDSREHRLTIMVVSELARAESANTVLRVKAKIASDASKGIPKRGIRSFGWEPDGMAIRESEAVHIREAVRGYLAGERSLMKIAKAWNEAGIQTDGMTRPRRGRGGDSKRMPRGYWTATTVRQLLLRPRNAGILIHHGAESTASQIEPIISRAELESLRSRVTVGTPVSERTQTALGGIIRCECGAPMHGTVSYSQRKNGPRHEYRIYKCSEYLYDTTRKHASINAHIAEQKVALSVLLYIAAGAVTADEAPEYGRRLDEIAERLTALTAQEVRAEDALVEGIGDPKRMKARIEAIKAERLELRDEQTRLEADRIGGNVFRVIEQMREVVLALAFDPDESPLTDLEEWAMTSVFEAWNAVPDEEQQALIRGRFLVRVCVGGRGADRVSVQPR